MQKFINQLVSPIKNIQDYHNTSLPLEQEVGDYLRLQTRTPKLYSNDWRHQYASAVFTQKYGYDTAKRLGDFNEKVNFHRSGSADTSADQRANEIGRQFALKNPNYSKTQLLDALFNYYNK